MTMRMRAHGQVGNSLKGGITPVLKAVSTACTSITGEPLPVCSLKQSQVASASFTLPRPQLPKAGDLYFGICNGRNEYLFYCVERAVLNRSEIISDLIGASEKVVCVSHRPVL